MAKSECVEDGRTKIVLGPAKKCLPGLADLRELVEDLPGDSEVSTVLSLDKHSGFGQQRANWNLFITPGLSVCLELWIPYLCWSWLYLCHGWASQERPLGKLSLRVPLVTLEEGKKERPCLGMRLICWNKNPESERESRVIQGSRVWYGEGFIGFRQSLKGV